MKAGPIGNRERELAQAWAAKELPGREIDIQAPTPEVARRLAEVNGRWDAQSKYEYVVVSDRKTGETYHLRVGADGNYSKNMQMVKDHLIYAIPVIGMLRLVYDVDTKNKWTGFKQHATVPVFFAKLVALFAGPIGWAAQAVPDLILAGKNLYDAEVERRSVVKVVNMHL